MKVLVVGGSGFIGKRLVEALRARGDDVVVTGRSASKLAKVFPAGVTCLEWDPMSGPLALPDGVDGVVNLAGEPLQTGRWTRSKKQRIRDSRVITTRHLVQAIAAAETKPSVLVQGSAIGWYGDRKHNVVNEDSPPADDFLGQVCQEWEAAAVAARESGVRVAVVRTGVVLGKGGGAYPLMTRPFRMFLGGMIGIGKRWMSWVHIDDEIGILLYCLDTPTAIGVYNATAPQPVSNGEWTKTLASVLKRPAFAHVPPIALHVVLGGFAAVVTASQRVQPLRTIGIGYEFKFPELRPALEDIE